MARSATDEIISLLTKANRALTLEEISIDIGEPLLSQTKGNPVPGIEFRGIVANAVEQMVLDGRVVAVTVWNEKCYWLEGKQPVDADEDDTADFDPDFVSSTFQEDDHFGKSDD